MRLWKFIVVLPCLVLAVRPAFGEQLDAIHLEMHDALAAISREYFAAAGDQPRLGFSRQHPAITLPSPWMIVVGFTGGIEGRDSRASGVVAINRNIDRYLSDNGKVLPLTYNNFHWRQATRDVLDAIVRYRADMRTLPGIRQPMIVAHGHSWGAGSLTKMARALKRDGIEISLAIYIDAFQFRNLRLPENIRYAVNFYQRAGILSGLPMRGKKKLLPENPEKTKVLGSYQIKPQTDRWGWSWNLLQPLLYRQHHRIAHDVRLKRYLQEIVNLNEEALCRTYLAAGRIEPPSLFKRVVILGASVSASQEALSPGWLLARHMGTPEREIYVFAEGGSNSSDNLPYLDTIERLKPTLIVAVDLLFHDFTFSLFLSESRKRYLSEYVRRLHDTGAVVVLGNIPSLVLLRHDHVNRFLDDLSPAFPNLVLMDLRALHDTLRNGGLHLPMAGREVILKKDDLFADRLHLNSVGSTVLANLILENLAARFPDQLPTPAKGIELPHYAGSESAP